MHADPPDQQQTFRLTPGWRRLFLSLPLMAMVFYLAVVCIPAIFLSLQSGNSSPFPFVPLAIIIAALTILCAIIFFPITYIISRRVRHTVSSAGIEYHALDYSIYTPWQNITGVEKMKLGIYYPPSLLLRVPAIDDSIENGKQRNVATIQRGWLLKKNHVLPKSLPLIFTVPRRDWRNSKLGAAIKHYAPQCIDPELDCAPEQQALHRTINLKLRILLAVYLITLPPFLLILPFASYSIQNVLAALLVGYWLLILCWFISIMHKRHLRWSSSAISMLLLCLFLLLASIFHLAFLNSWLYDPLVSFLNLQGEASILYLITLQSTYPFIYNPLARRFTAKETQQLAVLQAPSE